MIKNLGTMDQIIRFLLAAGCVVLIAAGMVKGALAIVVAVAGAVMLFTSLLGWCPLYGIVGLSTRRKSD